MRGGEGQVRGKVRDSRKCETVESSISEKILVRKSYQLESISEKVLVGEY